jgi:ribonuclease E
MLDDNPNDTNDTSSEGPAGSGDTPAPPTVTRTTRKTAARKTTTPRTRKAAAPAADSAGATEAPSGDTPEAPAAPVVKKTTRTRAPRKAAPAAADTPAQTTTETASEAPAAPDAQASSSDEPAPAKKATVRKTTRTRKAAAPAVAAADSGDAATDAGTEAPATTDEPAPAKKAAARKSSTRKTAAKKTAPAEGDAVAAAPAAPDAGADESTSDAAVERPARKTAKKSGSRSGAKKAAASTDTVDATADGTPVEADAAADAAGSTGGVVPLFQAPEATPTVTRRTRKSPARKVAAPEPEVVDPDAELDEDEDEATAEATAEATTGAQADDEQSDDEQSDDEQSDESGEGGNGPARRRRRRGGRRRRKSSDGTGSDSDTDGGDDDESQDDSTGSSDDTSDDSGEQGEGTSRRRRRRRRAGEEGPSDDDEPNTVTKVRSRRAAEDQITSLAGSTRLEAKKQRRREGREAGRRRAPIVSEAEFLARREAVDRVMVIRQRRELTQIAVLEDKVLVEHYVARESQTSLIGNVYLGRVQNVLPSMEAAFIDIGKGRNAVLYAGEVNWAALGHKEGQPRKIESVLSSGQSILVQVTKDPIGHKGARLTSQVSLAGRFLVYVPDGTTSGISRKLPDTERNRLKTLLKEIVPDSAGVIVRTAAEGASEDELTRDVERLKARWEDIEGKARGQAPALLYGEPDLTLKVVRDLFTEDFNKLVIQGDDAWETVQGYVEHVAPDLVDRVEKFEAPEGASAKKADIFAVYRIDEQIAKGLDRKVWLPSGGSLVIDRTEAMTVVDVNTGKFTGSGGNLEETVTKNNLEAAEEIVRQLRLRDIGGIIVVDFIDMVLESNRDLVVRRLVECLGRDRTRHQVAEVTSLGLVQMTRKRIGTGLLESFSHDCEACHGRGVVVQNEPVESGGGGDDEPQRSGRRGRGRGRDGATGNGGTSGNGGAPQSSAPSPKDVAAMARAEKADEAARVADSGADSDGSADTASPTGGVPTDTETTPSSTPDSAPDSTDDTASITKGGGRRGSRRGGRSGGRSRGGAGSAAPGASEATQAGEANEASGVAEAPASTEAPVGTDATVTTDASNDTDAAEAADTSGTSPVEVGAVEDVPARASVEPGTAVVDGPSSDESATEVEPAAEPERPRVVTRTRRRSASRPAGPPSGVAGTLPASGRVEPGTSDLEVGGEQAAVPDPSATDGGSEPHVEHVPIKKKGARKR